MQLTSIGRLRTFACAAVIVVVILFSSARGDIDQAEGCRYTAQVANVTLGLTIPRFVPDGAQIPVTITLINDNKEEIAFTFGKRIYERVTLCGPDGRRCTPTVAGAAAFPPTDGVGSLAANGRDEIQVDFAKWFVLTGPGRYTITVYRNFLIDHTKLRSVSITAAPFDYGKESLTIVGD